MSEPTTFCKVHQRTYFKAMGCPQCRMAKKKLEAAASLAGPTQEEQQGTNEELDNLMTYTRLNAIANGGTLKGYRMERLNWWLNQVPRRADPNEPAPETNRG